MLHQGSILSGWREALSRDLYVIDFPSPGYSLLRLKGNVLLELKTSLTTLENNTYPIRQKSNFSVFREKGKECVLIDQYCLGFHVNKTAQVFKSYCWTKGKSKRCQL